MKKFIILIFTISSIICTAQEIKNVDAATFKKFIEEKRSVLIDLRTTPEIEKKGMMKDAVQLDFFAKDAEEAISRLDKNKTYLVYCAGGGRSAQCADLMKSMGFKTVVNLEKGFDDWKTKGYEVVKK